MDIFVPDGYLTLRAAIQCVAAIIHGEKSVSLSEQEEKKLEREKRRLDDLRRPEPFEWSGPLPRDAALKIPGLSDADFQDLERKSSEVTKQQEAAQNILRQHLYAGRPPSLVLHHQGHLYNISSHFWGGDGARNILRSGKIAIGSDMGSVTGLVIIEAKALEAVFNPNEAVKDEPEPVAPEPPEEKPAKKSETHHRDEDIYKLFKDTSAANPQAKRGRIYDLMRVAQPGLFTNRREGARGKGIADSTIDRIIREQQ